MNWGCESVDAGLCSEALKGGASRPFFPNGHTAAAAQGERQHLLSPGRLQMSLLGRGSRHQEKAWESPSRCLG